MKKLMIMVMMMGTLTSCGNNVEMETETQEHAIVENMETEKIEVEKLDIEIVQSSDSDDDDEVETDERGDFILSHEDYVRLRGYVPMIAQKWTFDRYNFTELTNAEFDKFAKEWLLDCGTIVYEEEDGDTVGLRVFVDKYEYDNKAEAYFVMNGTGNWYGTVDIISVWSDKWISKHAYDIMHEICEAE